GRDGRAAWIQDDWTVKSRLTLNLGLRYDVAYGRFAKHQSVPPFLPTDRKIHKNRFQPRPGFAYTVNSKTVVRSGIGKFFGEVSDQPSLWASAWSHQLHPQIGYDGRADFASNPFNAPPGTAYLKSMPTF